MITSTSYPPEPTCRSATAPCSLSQPRARHGARLPFDFLLHSLAEAYGPRAICVILSGTGADGSLGLKSVKAKGGLVIAQDPGEAAYDGMPRSAIETGAVDLVLPVADIANALVAHTLGVSPVQMEDDEAPQDGAAEGLRRIVELLRSRTGHDFAHYKTGTLQRRVARRMAMAAAEAESLDAYIELLRRDPDELGRLAKELLIHVTSFFRDPKVFERLERQIIPDLVRSHPADQPLRIWVAGCSTGEETYSLAMLFQEAITAAGLATGLQVFASDVDADAIASAREGLYPATIAAEVSPVRLARFFAREEHGFRVVPELRAAVVFTVQDVLADPPFSRLDFVSCRNLLIYLRPEAQAKVISLFHFGLRKGGILLLGSSETLGDATGPFEAISRSDRIYRHMGRSRPGEFGLVMTQGDGLRPRVRMRPGPEDQRPAKLAELCRHVVLQSFAPASVLINEKNECQYSSGPVERYLRIAPGYPTHDLLAMAPQSLRNPAALGHPARRPGKRARRRAWRSHHP